ncbi:MAG: hypothetical protein DRQ55_01850 [Planctomycetota bacterium]|nr:MAG: hypothetical protein DRQ55_01850 [Planctomycetota bacterium]
MFKRRVVTLRTSLLLNLCAGVLLLGLALMAISVTSTNEAVETLSGALTSRVMALVEAKLEGFFDPVLVALEMVAERVDDGVFEHLPIDAMDRFYAPILASLPQLSSLMHAYVDGREYMLLSRADDAWLSRVTDPAGKPGVALMRRWQGPPTDAVMTQEELVYDARTRPWFQGAQTRGQALGEAAGVRERTFWTPPYRFFTTQEPGISASLAVPTRDGALALLGFDILLSDISRFTMDLVVGQRGKVFVMRGDPSDPGEIALIGLPDHPGSDDPEALARMVLSTPSELGGPVADLLSGPFPTDGVARAFESGGERWWGALQPSGLRVSENVWIGALIPESELLADLPDVRTWIALGTSLVVLGAFLRARRLARLYGGQLAGLAHQGERLERLDFQGQPTTESSILEIRQLGSTLESMRESLARFSAEREDLRVARSLRQMTLPGQDVAPPGWSLACWHDPAAEVEGELLDVVAAPEGCLHLLLADLSGGGVRAAVDGVALRAAFRALLGGAPALEQLATRLTHVVARDLGAGTSLKGWLARVDVSTATLTAVDLGGEPFALLDASGGVQFRGERGDDRALDVPPGTAPGPLLRVQLAPGAAVVFVSDGVTRALDESLRRFGLDGVAAALRGMDTRGATALAESLRAALADFDCDTERDRSVLVLARADDAARD